MRRIDADALKKTMLNYIDCKHDSTNHCADRCTAYDFLVMLEEAPTIEEKSYAMGYQDGAEDGLQGIRTPGKWVYRNDNPLIPSGYYECNVCEIGKSLTEQNYCPYCGADMRGDVETPHEIPTFNRKELEKARDYWYSHLEAHNEEQNEAAWAAINAIKYCIEHDSGYQEGAT